MKRAVLLQIDDATGTKRQRATAGAASAFQRLYSKPLGKAIEAHGPSPNPKIPQGTKNQFPSEAIRPKEFLRLYSSSRVSILASTLLLPG